MFAEGSVTKTPQIRFEECHEEYLRSVSVIPHYINGNLNES